MIGDIFAVVTSFFVHISASKFSLFEDLKMRNVSLINLILSFLFDIICIFFNLQHALKMLPPIVVIDDGIEI